MNEHTENNEPSLVKCDVCLKEVPKSDAKNAEVQDYVMHFCGVDCYDKWQKGKDTEADT